jgi:putative ABC transport system permease protein
MRPRQLADSVRTALTVGFQGLRCRPLRTALAGLSLFLGVLTVITVQASSQVAQQAVVARSELVSGRTPTFSLDIPAHRSALAAAREARARIAALADGRAATALTVTTDGSLGTGSGSVSVQLVAVDGDLRQIRPFPLRAGSWPGPRESGGLAPHLVLNEVAADALDSRPVARSLRIGRSTERPVPTIVGVVDDGQSEATAYLPLAEALRWDPGLADTGQTRLIVHEPEGASYRTALTAVLAAKQIPAQQFQRIDQGVELRSSVAVVQRIFLVIAAIAVIVGAIGILNIGLATVGERVDELALRRAVGSTRAQLGAIVLSEAVLVGVLAATAAVALSTVLLRPVALGLFPDLPPDTAITFPASAALVGVGTSCVAALVGGLIPAIRAARIPIANVMRA